MFSGVTLFRIVAFVIKSESGENIANTEIAYNVMSIFK